MKRLAWTLALGLAASACATVPRPPEGAAPAEAAVPAATTDAPAAAAPAQSAPSEVKTTKKQGTKAAPKTKAKTPSPGGGDVTERLARIEKMLAAVVQKLDAGGAKGKGASADEALQKKAAALKETAGRMETERNELKARVKGLEREVAALREEAEALRAKLAATK